jgi:hypothetical protein
VNYADSRLRHNEKKSIERVMGVGEASSWDAATVSKLAKAPDANAANLSLKLEVDTTWISFTAFYASMSLDLASSRL